MGNYEDTMVPINSFHASYSYFSLGVDGKTPAARIYLHFISIQTEKLGFWGFGVLGILIVRSEE
jgi:hypothetical protein